MLGGGGETLIFALNFLHWGCGGQQHFRFKMVFSIQHNMFLFDNQMFLFKKSLVWLHVISCSIYVSLDVRTVAAESFWSAMEDAQNSTVAHAPVTRRTFAGSHSYLDSGLIVWRHIDLDERHPQTGSWYTGRVQIEAYQVVQRTLPTLIRSPLLLVLRLFSCCCCCRCRWCCCCVCI